MSCRRAAFLGGLAACLAVAESVTPIQKVLQLMEDMKTKGISEKEAEAVRFSAFDQWCTDQKRIKTDEINTGAKLIEKLAAGIEKDTVHIKKLSSRIEELEADIDRWVKDKASATDVRKKEAADYVATSNDFSESLSALDQAIAVLKKHDAKTAQEEALLQVRHLRLVPISMKQQLAAFLQQPVVEEMPGERVLREAPEAYGYEFQSGGVVDMLQRLKDQFDQQKYDTDREELSAKQAFKEMVEQLSNNVENAQHEVNKKTAVRAETQKAKAGKEGEKAQAESDRAEDQKYLDETGALCSQNAEDFGARQKLRAEEIEALSKAIEIISSEMVASAGEKHLPGLLQTGAAFAQLRSTVVGDLQGRVSAFLNMRAKVLHSRRLEEVAARVSADPFIKVKKMIKDLISKLMEKSTSETEHKGWCDAELASNKVTRDSKTEGVEQLTNKKEDLTILITQLTQDIEDLTAAIAEFDQAMQAATEERTASREKNEATIKDAKEAQAAVQKAITVLKDYYAKSAQAASLVQTKQSPGLDAPETFDKPYQGLLPEGGNVVSFLEVVLTDFARLEAETSTSEATEQDTFDKFIFESKKDRALKENDKSHKQAKRTDSEQALSETQEELKLTQSQLDKAVAYYDKLKPTCVDSGVTYEERVKRREEEVQSLQEALGILRGTDLS